MQLLEDKAVYEDRINYLSNSARKRWESSNVGKNFKNCTFDTFTGTEFLKQKEMCQQYVEKFQDNGKGLFLFGSVGTGKTHLVTAVANAIVYDIGLSAYFDTFAGIIREIQRSFNDKRDSDVEETAKKTGLLILDDLGKEKYSDWASQILFDIIDTRYKNQRPVLITSNYSPEELSKRVDEAIMSRLIEMCTMIRLEGTDHRRMNGEY